MYVSIARCDPVCTDVDVDALAGRMPRKRRKFAVS
jgi:hypothetical protein